MNGVRDSRDRASSIKNLIHHGKNELEKAETVASGIQNAKTPENHNAK